MTDGSPPGPLFVSLAETARLLSVSERHAYLVRDGTLQSQRFGRRIVVRFAALKALVDQPQADG